MSRKIVANLTVGICRDVAGKGGKDTLVRECVGHLFIVLLALGLIVFAAACVKVK